jgi:hypothetical protein
MGGKNGYSVTLRKIALNGDRELSLHKIQVPAI